MKKKKFFKLVLLCLSFIFCLGLFAGCEDSSGRGNESDERYKAYETAKSYVEDELKSPTTAEFASINEAKITKLGKDEYQIESYVNAENSFGAKVKSTFSCRIVVDYDKEKVDCYDLVIK
ncbi:hypothetical protein [Clostridium sporogenes]|uniref:hypothetical protein n=1 Tax=Clostridium sporogenes TaxID=1509 RepID=UPI002237CC96|nr:hypothetical protein [Clostridium sporogenes]EJO5347004.1 hypothetical protein [Clostridium botulinum]MCW6124292.1 hypothetical protein [Clostridium sporogenes]